MDSKQRAERLIEDFFLTEGQIDVEVIGERDRKELIQLIAVALEQDRRQTSAEVLAACSANVEETCKILLKTDRPKDEKILIAGACTLVQSRLEVLSPAASDLEALLEEARREAELKGLRMECTGMRMHKIYDTAGKVLCPACDRMLKLEKARAEGKGNG
ncbi:MAG: hypothetical protein J3T61_09640 [Candidatus Brocadiales bacterium]|nr:hypothetical protein [Candidatus Bathyanammoxibius sp.]